MRTQTALVKKRSITPSDIGTEVFSWIDLGRINGYMDAITMSKGERASKIVEDSTHVFMTYEMIGVEQGDRMYISGVGYEVTVVDNPAMLNHHLEIELKPLMEQQSQLESFIYYGFNGDSEISETEILALDNHAFKTKAFVTDLERTASHVVLSYPKSYGKSSIRINNKLITNWNIKELIVNGVPHYVYTLGTQEAKLHIELF